jgi:predicted XRE-type DNA-binding protein
MEQLKYSNIFEAMTDDPTEAADLEFRADLMLVLREYFAERNATQAQIGKILGVAQPRVSELMRGKVDKFSSDKLIGFLARVGYRLKPTYSKASKRTQMRIRCDVAAAA